MNIILLSGGSGKRLWPLSSDVRSKQFLKLFKNNEGRYESMLQRIYKQILAVDQNANITIATNKKQVSTIINQLNEIGIDNCSICTEPERRDTFPAVSLATAYLRDEKHLDKNDIAIICPIDPFVTIDYFKSLMKLHKLATDNTGNLSLMGVKPTYPSEKYGYIIPRDNVEFSEVLSFKEKPTVDKAKEYIMQNALWNCGVFAYKIGYVLDICEKIIGYSDYKSLYDNYATLEKISFDYAVVENEKNIKVMEYVGEWKDIGTWNTLVSEVNTNIGEVLQNETCRNINVINELDIPIICIGLSDVIVASSNSGILISDKEQSSYIKDYVEKISDKVLFAEKSWGKYEVIDADDNSLTVKITLNENRKMNYHYHENRDEILTIIGGNGKVILNDEEISIKEGDVIKIPRLTKHTLIADNKIKAMEVQIGEISVHDKIKV